MISKFKINLSNKSRINYQNIIFIQLIFAKGFSVEDFGLFSSVIALLVIFIPFVNFGVSQFILKNSYYKILKNEEVLLLIISSIFILNFYNTIILSYSFVFFEICLFLVSFILTSKYIFYEKI